MRRRARGPQGSAPALSQAYEGLGDLGTQLIGAVDMARDPDADSNIVAIAGIDQLACVKGNWVVEQRLNGDQSNHGRQLLMDAHAFHVYRVRLYTYSRQQHPE